MKDTTRDQLDAQLRLLRARRGGLARGADLDRATAISARGAPSRGPTPTTFTTRAPYMHGGYNRETTIMAGVPVLNEDLVNLPNWLLLELRIEEEEAVGANNVEATRLPARAGPPQRHPHPGPEVPRPGGSGDKDRDPPLREHGRPAPGGDRVEDHPRRTGPARWRS